MLSQDSIKPIKPPDNVMVRGQIFVRSNILIPAWKGEGLRTATFLVSERNKFSPLLLRKCDATVFIENRLE